MRTERPRARPQAIGCALCAQIAGRPLGDLIHTLLGETSYTRRALDVTRSFTLVPSLGALGSVHLLLCPRYHRRRFLDLRNGAPHEFDSAVIAARSLVEQPGAANIAIFEHGASRRAPEVPCSVEHAHLHLVALPSNTYVNISNPNIEWNQVPTGIAGASRSVDDREYLLWHDDNRGTLVGHARAGTSIPSQVLRRAIANALGDGEAWNWRIAPNPLATDHLFRSLLQPVSKHGLTR